MRTPLMLALFAVLLVGCAEDPDATVDPADVPERDPDVTGVLAGDPMLEGGCVWVATEEENFEVIWPEGMRVEVDPIVLRDEDGTVVAEQGDDVWLWGEVDDDVLTVCQVGRVFRAEALHLP